MLNIILPSYLNDFSVIFFSIFVEGIPFILIGTILSAIVDVWISEHRIAKLLPKKKPTQFLTMGLLGNLVPVCECGNIPFARRLVLKNIPPHLALTFLLAAPAFNPIVIASTLAAFPGNYAITIYRVLFTLLIALFVGYAMSFLRSDDVLSRAFLARLRSKKPRHEHEHQHGKPIRSIFGVAKKEFLEMMGIFLFGALVATAIQLFTPKDFVLAFNQSEWLAILALMSLAFIISICSNVDAFFALAYAQIFPMSSILAFLVLGPMIDIKAIPMLRTIFSWKAILFIVLLIGLLTFNLSYLYYIFL